MKDGTTLGDIWRDNPLSPEGRVKVLEAENARLREACKQARAHLLRYSEATPVDYLDRVLEEEAEA